jgi:hypothetical protein
MLTLHNFPGMDSQMSVGLAWHFEVDAYMHDGGDPGISTATYFDPEADQGVVFFSNGTDLSSLNIPNLVRGLFFFNETPLLLKEKMVTP